MPARIQPLTMPFCAPIRTTVPLRKDKKSNDMWSNLCFKRVKYNATHQAAQAHVKKRIAHISSRAYPRMPPKTTMA
jgi:hypothetical protein